MNPDIRKVLTDRWPVKHDALPWMAPAKSLLGQIVDAMEAIHARQAEIAKDNNLSPLGRQDAFRKFLGANTAPHLHFARKAIETMRVKLADERKRLLPASPDRSDLAGAVLRSEMRTMLRGQSPAKRSEMLLGVDADPLVISAALEAPNISSGINDETRAKLTNRAIERAHPGALRLIEEVEDAVSIVDTAYRMATNTAQKAAEFHNERVLGDFLAASLADRVAAIEDHVRSDFFGFAEIAA